MTIFKDSHHFSRTWGDVWWQSLKTVFNGNAFFEGTLRGRFREKIKPLFLNSGQLMNRSRYSCCARPTMGKTRDSATHNYPIPLPAQGSVAPTHPALDRRTITGTSKRRSAYPGDDTTKPHHRRRCWLYYTVGRWFWWSTLLLASFRKAWHYSQGC